MAVTDREVQLADFTVDEPITPFTLVDKSLLDDGKVFLTGEIDSESVGKVIRELLYLDSRDRASRITLYLNSEGGDPYEILTLYDVVRFAMKSKVDIIVQGKAMSSGACIAAICATGKRYAGPNATFMLHESSSMTSGKASDLEIDVKETKRIDRRVNALLVKHTKLKLKDLNEKFLKNTYFTSSKALELGIIDVIL